MHILKTKKQKQEAEHASRLEILRELNKREALTDALKDEHRELEKMTWAVDDIIRQMKKYYLDDWRVMQDLTFIHGAEIVTCDILLLTNHQIYTFDIDTTTADPTTKIFKKESSGSLIKEILKSFKQRVQIQSYLLLLNEPAEGTMDQRSSQAKIISQEQLTETFEEIAEKERMNERLLDKRTIFKILEAEEFRPASLPKSLSKKIMDKVRPGINCSHCNSFDIKIGEIYISCACGTNESLEEAIVRTICEFGVLHLEMTYFDPFELHDFFDGDISIFQLIYYLEKHFVNVHIE